MAKALRECLCAVPVLLFGNLLLLWQMRAESTTALYIVLTVVLSLWYLVVLCRIYRKHAGSRRLAMIAHGLRLVRYTVFCCAVQPLLCILVLVLRTPQNWADTAWFAGNLLFFAVFILLMLLYGLVRLGVAARQVKWYWYVILYLVFWIPVVNLLPLLHIYRTARREFYFEAAKLEMDAIRKESEICKTKYPILMVHGIFFRDWQLFNYWGRIPAALQKNGADIYYGNQQSAQSIAASAQELAAQMRSVLEQTGAEKLNIIAHSKGGLDTRYAMHELGMAQYVASLTTIGTPHQGCAWAEELLEKIPASVQEWIAAKYAKIFRGLGDKSPDFLGGVHDLTASHCAQFNAAYPVLPDIPHHCIATQMRSVCSAPFPLWAGYLCNRMVDRKCKSDGLVPVDAAQLEGAECTVLPPPKFRGISHGDMIDLFRENIKGFDVREFYVGLVKDLKEQGL